MTEFRDPYGQQWQEVERLPQNVDLSPVARALSQYRVPHRITEEAGSQVVWVAREQDREQVAKFIDDWRRGDIEIVQQPASARADEEPHYGNQLRLMLRMLPVTCGLLLLSLLGYLVVITDNQLMIGHWFTIVDISQYRFADLNDLDLTEFWRLWTPMFLHFDLIHIAFNALFVWVFGARMERVMGSGHFLLFVAATGLIANLGQLGWESNPRFGGMSGVNYGFIGYIWLRQLLAPHPMLAFPKGLIPLMLLMLILGTFGFFNFFMEGRVANAAHITGLLVGMTWGLVAGLSHSRGGVARP
ncbi:rhomboid family intramembrane serine protease [Proteobacteria bacterium 005FR1]|nr:rhomboid family intramembrane serine protease [Proteobacteria bacterium 005FR1]